MSTCQKIKNQFGSYQIGNYLVSNYQFDNCRKTRINLATINWQLYPDNVRETF